MSTSSLNQPGKLRAWSWIAAVMLLAPMAVRAADETPSFKSSPAADVAIVKQLLATAATWDASTKAKLSEAAAKISDAPLRTATLALLPELEAIAAQRARMQALQKQLDEFKGAVKTEPAGPAWLRELVGDEPMVVFDRLTGVDLADRRNPHSKDYKLNDKINDEWLARLVAFPELKTLDVANTSIQGPGLKHVAQLTNLESLNLTLTPVKDEYLGQLKTLTRLKILGLASTKITGEGFKELGTLTSLVNLNCHYTPVNDAGLKEISQVTSLERLEIVHTHFTDAGAAHLAKLVNLKRLQIGSRDATGAAVANLLPLKNLEELDLSDNQPTLEGLQYACQIPSLKVLRISQGNSQDAAIELIAKLPKLEHLVLGHTGISDAGVDQLAQLTQLKKLELRSPRFSPEAIARLKKALPSLEVLP